MAATTSRKSVCKKESNVTFQATVKTAAAVAGLAAAAIFTATSASAAPAKPFGTMEEASSNNGADVADITVGNLKPSGHNDGVLEADATIKTVKGFVTPHIGDFHAVGPNGANYSAVLGNNPDGLPAGEIPAGQSRSGKLYFTVNGGAQRNSVVFTPVDANDQLVWKD
ncbi:DUF1942 domain-containing protein [Mycobacterium servetii]|uniref:DUF1942 domain-containing protein n=1 Tax=Mycobacterium servetii TaxID=3237418 RepID=A0ABV4BZZ8_9MYCO